MIEHVIIEGILAGLLVFQAYRHDQEKRALINRILTRDLPELATFEKDTKRAKIEKVKPEPGIEL